MQQICSRINPATNIASNFGRNLLMTLTFTINTLAVAGALIGLAGIVAFLTWMTFLMVAGVRQLRAGS